MSLVPCFSSANRPLNSWLVLRDRRHVDGGYRTVRDRREMDIRFALGRNYLNGTNGLPRNLDLARYWFDEAAGLGSQPTKTVLATLANAQPN